MYDRSCGRDSIRRNSSERIQSANQIGRWDLNALLSDRHDQKVCYHSSLVAELSLTGNAERMHSECFLHNMRDSNDPVRQKPVPERFLPVTVLMDPGK